MMEVILDQVKAQLVANLVKMENPKRILKRACVAISRKQL